LQVHGVEGRYAAALYSAAHKQKSLEAVEKDMKAFGDVCKSDTRLRVIESALIANSPHRFLLHLHVSTADSRCLIDL
jgi:F-type H+-transporting ATPase subunit O